MSDLSSITASNREFEIVSPEDDQPIGLVFELRHGSSDEVKAFEKKWTDSQLRKRGIQKLTAAGLEFRNTGRIVSAVAGWNWKGDASWHGEKPEFSEATLREVMKEADWIRVQLDEELGNEAAFFKS